MTTAENSRADALTDEQILALAERMSIGSREYYKFGDTRMVAFARALLAASPVEQPAAAPIDECDTDHEYRWPSAETPAPSPADERAAIGWAWISPTGHVSRFTADFDGKHDQLATGWKVRPVAFCDSADTETVAEGAKPVAVVRVGSLPHGPFNFDTTPHGVDTLPSGVHQLYLESRSPAMAAEAVASPATAILLAEPHTGMRVDYSGLLKQARHALKLGMQDTGSAEMLRQLQNHLTELGQRWYAGDTAVVDELLQLYCVEKDARDALAAAPQPVQAGARVGLTDERAAKLAAFKAIVSDSGMSNYDYFCEGWERARAASVNGTGAEGAKLNKPAKVGATRFGVGVKWSTVIGAAQRLYEYEVTPEKEAARIERARSVLDDIRNGKYASEPAQADARVGLTESATVVRIEQLRKALFESRDAMRVMSNWVKKSDPAGHSWAVHMVDRTNAALNGEPEPRAEVTGWQPIETAPPDTEVVVFWLDPESPEHPERYDFDMLDDGCWRQWTDHYEWAHSVAPAGSRLPREQAPYTHWKPLGSPAPIAAARTGASS